MPLRDVEALKQDAGDAHAQGNLPAAVDLLTRAIKLCAAKDLRNEMDEVRRRRLLSTLLSNRAALYAQQQAFTHSLADASAAIKADSTWPKPYLRQATALLGLGQPHAALQALDRGVVACSPTHQDAAPNGTGGSTLQLQRANSAESKDVWQLLSVRADVEAAALAQQRAAKRLRAIPQMRGSGHVVSDAVAPNSDNGASGAAGAGAGGGGKRAATVVASNADFAVQGGPGLVAHCLDLLDGSAKSRGLPPGPQPEERRIGVTVISGFLGAGKTTLLSRLLAEGPGLLTGKQHAGGSKPLRFGVVVNDMASINIDGILLHEGKASDKVAPGKAAAAAAAAVVGGNGTHHHHHHSHPHSNGNGNGAVDKQQQMQQVRAAVGQKRDHATMQQQQQQLPNGHGAAEDGGKHQVAQEKEAEQAGQEQEDEEEVDHMVELSNGCICCGLKGDLLLAVSQLLCAAPDINYLVVESTGVGQPMPIAAAFSSPDHRGRTLMDYVRLDCLVTVVDTPRFQAHLRSVHVPLVASDLALANATGGGEPCDHPEHQHHASPGEGEAGSMLVEEEDRRPLAELLAEQVEFADVVLLNKSEMMCGGDGGVGPNALVLEPGAPIAPPAKPTNGKASSAAANEQKKEEGAGGKVEEEVACPAALRQVADLVRGLNPRARVIATHFCGCPLSEVVNTHRFDFDAASQGARWQHELLGTWDSTVNRNHIHETEIYGINTIVYTSRRPFHPGRLLDWLTQGFEASMRAEPLPAGTAAAAKVDVTAAATAHNDQGHPGAPELPPAKLPPQLLRSKGFFWLASCPQVCWEWSTAGAASRMSTYGEWMAGKVPRRLWPAPGKRADWDADWGDRCTSLVFIMHGSAELGLVKVGLDACLLTDEEMLFPPLPKEQQGHHEGKHGQEEAEESEEEESEDSKWSRREEVWAGLPGAQAWAALLDA